jgi:7,8-dihydropterin-6-yl-methyl-4-(beta-D-ribofuranosyl)aminobenzene 5'-phosphate synthase
MASESTPRQAGEVVVTILVDNHASDGRLEAEHGLSIHIAGRGREILFDAGQSEQALRRNAKALGISLEDVQAVVLSHGHYDHTGGLPAVLRASATPTVYAHPQAFAPRWSQKPGLPLKDVSNPHKRERLQAYGAAIRAVRSPEPLEDWLLLSGPIGGDPWGVEQFVVRRGEDMLSDGFEDELCLLVRGGDGWAVVTGCCHRGLANTLRTARFVIRRSPIRAIVGGLHLRRVPHEGLDELLAVLSGFGRPALYPCHCTGDAAIRYLEERYPGEVHAVSAGSRIRL